LGYYTEADLKRWIEEWRTAGSIEILGLDKKERVPKCEKNHRIKLRK